MKKLIISLVAIGLLFGWASAVYQPTSGDLAQATLLKNQLNSITTGDMKGKWDFYAQLRALKEQYPNHEQLNYYFDELGTHLLTQVNTEKVKAKVTSKTTKQDFVNQYSGWFTQEITGADACTGRYNTMDTISYANNFPTALMMATRYREAHCGYYLPSNGDGPFQIVSKDYGTGQITEAKFLQAMQDFIDFSKAKHTQYTTRLWIKLTYTWFTMTGLANHTALYNGGVITWNDTDWYAMLPINPHYLYDGYGTWFTGALRYGLIPKFLKLLDWEVKTQY